MRVPLWVSGAAAELWDAAGDPEPFPRTLRQPIARSAFALTIKELRGLSVRVAEHYLTGLGIVWACGSPDRPLRACLTAWADAGFILLAADDASDEKTFSLAHELAHFLHHYRGPRQRVRRTLGDRVMEVLDGLRAPTPAERVHALLASIPLGLHVHLMKRGPHQESPDKQTLVMEQEADRLAYELLAPAAAVAQVAGSADRAQLAALVRDEFGLPTAQALDYSHLLLPSVPEDPLIKKLRFPR